VVTGLSLDWSNFFSTDQSKPIVATLLSIHWPKLFFVSPVNYLGFRDVLTVLSIDNSKNIFLATRGLVVCMLGVMSLLGEQTELLLELALVSNL